jgi:8-oxo-dGTP diphosphatase
VTNPPSHLLAEEIAAASAVIGTTLAEFGAFLSEPPNWERAHLTAIAWVLDEPRRSILLVEHRLHGWSCAGGHVEPGEHPRMTAARELAEETGLVAEPAPRPFMLGVSSGCARVPSACHWTVGYLFTVDPGAVLRPEHGQPVRWFPLERLPAPRTADVDVVLDSLRRR